MRYPLYPPIPRRLPELRTHEAIIECMQNAPRMGIKGHAAFMNMDHFDLGCGFSTDDLHPVFLGVATFHLSLFMTSVNEPRYYIGSPASRLMINDRLKNIRTPTFISRKPSDIDVYEQWQGSEARKMLLYYLVPVLQGIVPVQRYLDHFALLSQAIFLISRDSILPAELDEAEKCINEYVELFEEYFGEENMRYNVHTLTHIVQCIGA